MDDDEKLALKKAYADIIMSISTETAARVLASERKSAMFQHELKVAKEEGVRMLVRLKQMMDSQSREAEAASLTQRKKIEELEAQLQEAEDIVRDLRDELENVQAKLERVKSGNFHLNDVCSKEVPMENRVTLHQSGEYLPSNESPVAFDPTVPDLSQKNECLKCCNKAVCSCDVFPGNQDLPSIIVVDKDPGLYRNGCTQRIRACERNLLDGDSCLSDETDKARRNPKAPALVAKIPTELETKLLGGTNFGTSKSFSRKRKRASRQKKTILLLGGKQSHPTSKLGHSVNDKAHSAENPSEIGSQLSRYNGEPQSQLQPAKASESVGNIVENEGEKEKMVPLKGVTEVSDSFLSLKDVEKVDVPSPGSVSKLSDATKGITSHPVTLKGMEVIYTYQRKRKRQSLSLSEMKGSHEMGKKTGDGKNGGQKLEQSLSLSEMNGSHEMGKKTGDGKNGGQKLEQPKPSLLRESSGVIGSCATTKKKGDKGTGVQKLEDTESGWLEGSLREHKRMVQVARQLLSLSDEKLWR